MTDEEIVRLYADMVYKVAFGYVRNRTDADDVFSEVFLKLFAKKRSFDSEEHRKAWLIRVTINEAKDFISSRMQYDDIDEVFDVGIAAHDGSHEKLETMSAIMELTPEYRDAIYLFYYEGLSVKEIAKALQTNENTIKTRLSRAREKLAVLLA